MATHVANYVVVVRRSLNSWWAALVMVTLTPLIVTVPSNSVSAATRSCHAPRMIGLTVAAARNRAALRGCQLRLSGALVKMAQIQSIRTQSPRPGQVTKLLTVVVNPLCPSSSNIGPPPGEPLETPGPTELDTGLFIEGGAFIYRSAPNCKDLMGKSSAGTITVTNSSGTVIADSTLTTGQLLKITLDAGQYTIAGIFAGGNHVGPTTVTVAAGEVVRQDLVLDVP